MKALHSDLGEVKVFAGGNTFAYIAIDNLDSNRIISKPSIIVKSRGISISNIMMVSLHIKMKCGHILQMTIIKLSLCTIL